MNLPSWLTPGEVVVATGLVTMVATSVGDYFVAKYKDDKRPLVKAAMGMLHLALLWIAQKRQPTQQQPPGAAQ